MPRTGRCDTISQLHSSVVKRYLTADKAAVRASMAAKAKAAVTEHLNCHSNDGAVASLNALAVHAYPKWFQRYITPRRGAT